MSLERQFPDHILSPRLAHRTNGQRSGTAVNWSNLGWWVPTCVSVTCKNKEMGWHMETGDTLGWTTPPHHHPPHPPAPHPHNLLQYTHTHTHVHTSTCPSPSPLALWKQHHVPDTEAVVTITIRVSWAALFTQMLKVLLWLCVSVYLKKNNLCNCNFFFSRAVIRALSHVES